MAVMSVKLMQQEKNTTAAQPAVAILASLLRYPQIITRSPISSGIGPKGFLLVNQSNIIICPFTDWSLSYIILHFALE